ncbi:hypothetical protein EMCG_04793 [[Emmonsia] crescens]|uniref:Uncharacterized protein n=1 Tax=[Emmonsia] crescens TaxID=73230 RepID=A0A0G2HS36_9EURO|nr:hypothetical protein EMCG_04793 [Emmonsia crescens UAMH 3008]
MSGRVARLYIPRLDDWKKRPLSLYHHVSFINEQTVLKLSGAKTPRRFEMKALGTPAEVVVASRTFISPRDAESEEVSNFTTGAQITMPATG